MADDTCSVDGCNRAHRRRGWCATHYSRWRQSGDVQAHIPIESIVRRNPLCVIEGCGQPHLALGYCVMHYGRLRKNGDPRIKTLIDRPDPVCQFEECQAVATARGLCSKHYTRLRIHGDPSISLRRQLANERCKVDGCDRATKCLGLCAGHYVRLRKTGDVRPETPLRPKAPKWNEQRCGATACSNHAKAHGLCLKHYHARWNKAVNADPTRAAARRLRQNERVRALKERDPEILRARARAWRVNNPLTVRMIDARKRARRQNIRQYDFAADQLAERMRYWGNQCWMCGGPFEEIDHVKPVSKGGAHGLMNLRPACHRDNSRKRDTWPYPVSTRSSRRRYADAGPNGSNPV